MFVFVFEGALFRFRATNEQLAPLLKFPPRFAARFFTASIIRPVVSGEARYTRFAFIHPLFIRPISTIFPAITSYCPILMYRRSRARRTMTCR